jgi:hypothetical protein
MVFAYAGRRQTRIKRIVVSQCRVAKAWRFVVLITVVLKGRPKR